MFRPISLFLLVILFVQSRGSVLTTQWSSFWLFLLLCVVPLASIISAIYSNKTRVSQLIATLMILFSWATSIFLFPWGESIRWLIGYELIVGDVIILFPVVFWLFFLWLVTSPIANSISYALYRLRLDILLLFVQVFIYFGICELSTKLTPIEEYSDIVGIVALLIVLSFSPFLISTILPAKQMKNYELRTSIVDVGYRAGISYPKVLVWNTHNRIMNAMAIGLFFQSRSIILTDKLISTLTTKELLAVSAHEIAHHKYWHIPFLFVTLVCAMLWSTELALLMDFNLAEGYIYITQLVIMVGAVIVVSCQFEKQADSYAVANLSAAQSSEVITRESVNSMTSALGVVAQVQNANTSRYDPLHGSIQSRQHSLFELVGCNLSDIPINNKVRWIKIVLVVLLIAGIVI